MKLIVTGKKINANIERIIAKSKDCGQVFSEDRFYTIVNEYLDCNLKKHSRLLYYIVAFLFRSSNYKHSVDIVNGKPLWIWIVDIFCWFCLTAFIVCLIAGIAQPISVALSGLIKFDFSSINKAFQQTFADPTAVVLLVISFITFGIAMFYLYLLKKVIAVNRRYGLKDFVVYKTSFILNRERYISINHDLNKKTLKKLEKMLKKQQGSNHPPYWLVRNLDIFDDPVRWTILQVTNVMNKLFPDFALTLIFDHVPDERAKTMINTIDLDFKYLKANVVTETNDPLST